MLSVPKYRQWKGSPLSRIPSLKSLKLEWPDYSGIGIGIRQIVSHDKYVKENH
jgi:hypothetical protein